MARNNIGIFVLFLNLVVIIGIGVWLYYRLIYGRPKKKSIEIIEGNIYSTLKKNVVTLDNKSGRQVIVIINGGAEYLGGGEYKFYPTSLPITISLRYDGLQHITNKKINRSGLYIITREGIYDAYDVAKNFSIINLTGDKIRTSIDGRGVIEETKNNFTIPYVHKGMTLSFNVGGNTIKYTIQNPHAPIYIIKYKVIKTDIYYSKSLSASPNKFNYAVTDSPPVAISLPNKSALRYVNVLKNPSDKGVTIEVTYPFIYIPKELGNWVSSGNGSRVTEVLPIGNYRYTTEGSLHPI